MLISCSLFSAGASGVRARGLADLSRKKPLLPEPALRRLLSLLTCTGVENDRTIPIFSCPDCNTKHIRISQSNQDLLSILIDNVLSGYTCGLGYLRFVKYSKQLFPVSPSIFELV